MKEPPRNEFVLAHAQDPALSPHYQVMVDVDSTVYPLLDAIATRPDGQRVSYENAREWSCLTGLVEGGLPRLLELFGECMVYEVMRHHPPLPGAAAALQTMRDHGLTLHVMTQRPPHYAEDTQRYLREFGVPYDSFICDLEHDKLQLCQQRGISILIDDHPQLLARAHAAGLTALSLHWPYNAEVIREHQLPRSHSWADLSAHALAAVEARVRSALAGNESRA